MCWLPLVAAVLLAAAAKGQPSHCALGATGGGILAANGLTAEYERPTFGIDAAALWQQDDSTQFWTRFWQQPLFGFRVNYARIPHGIAGDRIGLAGTMQSTVAGRLDWVYSVGLSFYTKPYSLTRDANNTYIGSLVNCLIDFGFVYRLPLSDGLAGTLAAKLIHSSNGYMYKPNHGLNYVQLEAGLLFGPRRRQSHTMRLPVDTAYTAHGRPFVAVAPSAVMSYFDHPDSIIYHPAYTLQLGYIRHPHPCFAYGGTVDLSYNFSHRARAPQHQWPVYPALSAFGDVRWGHYVLRLGLAHYLGRYPLNHRQYYERVGLYRTFGRGGRHMAGVGMKVHYEHIDFIEWTYGVEL